MTEQEFREQIAEQCVIIDGLNHDVVELEQRLAVFMDKIPEGRHCSDCQFKQETRDYAKGLCHVGGLDIERGWDWLGQRYADFEKHPSCPKYKEAK